MAISRVRMNAFEAACMVYSNEKHISLYAKCDYGTMAVRYGVNWGALGTVDPEEAYDFADAMRQMAKVASEVNRLELVYDWDLEDPQIKTKEDYDAQVAQLVAWLREGRSAKVARFMEAGDI